MERILSVAEMYKADEYTINNLGFSRETLIERAGLAVASVIKNRFHGGRVLVCIGKGNNGEDGKIIAKVLSNAHGFTVTTLNVYNGIFKLLDREYDIIVDCIFGIGLNREVDGKYKEVIEKINSSKAFVISCDVASGLNADTGMPMGVAIKADLTVAIQEYKLGHFLNQGIDYSGKVIAKDIGISIWGEDYAKKLTDEDARKYFVPSIRNVNKGNFKKTLIIGGSKDYSGSAILSFNALLALKMGNGYSHLGVPDCLFNSVVGLNPECIIKSLPETDGKLVFNQSVYENLLNFDSIAFGMGVTVSQEIYKIIKFLLKNYTGTLLIDADGLNTLSKYGVEVLKDKKCKVVLTPHVLEFARLIGKEKQEVIDNQISLSKQFAKEYEVIINLKSAVSIITDGVDAILNVTGTSGMAKAGSGDVLSGITAGILAKSQDILEATAVSAYIFGKCGEFVEKKDTEFTLTATYIINALPQVIKNL